MTDTKFTPTDPDEASEIETVDVFVDDLVQALGKETIDRDAFFDLVGEPPNVHAYPSDGTRTDASIVLEPTDFVNEDGGLVDRIETGGVTAELIVA